MPWFKSFGVIFGGMVLLLLGDFNLNADLGLRAQLTEKMFGEFKVEWRHDASPAPGADENDLRYTIGVGWKF